MPAMERRKMVIEAARRGPSRMTQVNAPRFIKA